MRKNILFIVFVSLFGQSFSQIYPDIHYSRPRIYVDSSRFAYLQSNMSTGACGTAYTTFNNAVFSNWYNDPQLYMLGTDSSVWTWDFTSHWAQWQGLFVPFLYKINNDSTALKRCRFLIDKINERLDTMNFNYQSWYAFEDLARSTADVGGMLYDWCYDNLPIAQRQHFAQNLYRLDSYFMNHYILSSAGTAYVTGHNIWNVYYANQYALVLDSAADLTQLQRDTVRGWYQVSYDKAANEILPVAGYYRDDDGGWNWTAAYSMWSLVDEFQFFENMRIATGKNFYTDLPWIHNSINQYWYFLQPDNYTINWGDGYSNVQGDRVIYRHAQIYNDPRSLWLAQYWSLPANITWTVPRYQLLMYKDFSMPTVTKPDIAHDWFSDKTGLSVSRTGWNDTASLVWMYNAPTKKAGHEHRDNNTFCIYKNGPQINNSGYYNSYGDTHYTNYYMRTIATNSVCVFDSTDVYSNWGVGVSNDGGQNESPTLMNFSNIFSPAAQKGRWELWGAGTDYCYTITDAEQSYDTAKLDRFRRRVLFYKPNQVIVLDHLHLKNITTHQRDAKFILHFQKQPTISGSIINTAVTNHIETFTGHDILQTNGRGNVAVRTLLPANATTTRIGGNGYEFYVNGVNYPEGGITDSTHTTTGNWRIEVSPTTVTDSLIFLHTIAIGDSTNVSVAGGVGQQNNYTIGVDWTNTLFFFNAQGDTNSTYQVMNNVPGGRTVKIFGGDLVPTMLYDVLVDNNVVSSHTTDTVGVLETTITLGPGNHKVEISNQTVGISTNIMNEGGIFIYPNPATNLLTLRCEELISKEIKIVNLLGKTVYQATIINHLSTIDISNLSSGVYFIQLKQGSNNYNCKFVKQ